MKGMSKNLLALFVLGGMFASCDQLKDLSYSTTPNPLEMHGDSVAVSVTVTVPEKGLNKKLSVEIIPTLGNATLTTWKIQGEKATGNGQSISFKPGGTATFTDVVAYDPSMEASELKLTGKVFQGDKEKSKEAIPETKLADATIITPLLVRPQFQMMYETAEIPRSDEKTVTAKINFLRGKYDVRPNEISDSDIQNLISWFKSAQTNPKIKINGITITGYASPDGEESMNNPLSNNRTLSSRSSIIALFKKNNITGFADTSMYALSASGEDMAGFQEELSKSSAIPQDNKDLFIRVLGMGNANDKKEDDIYALSKGFTVLEKEIFPKLRRAEIVVSYTEEGLNDEELKAKALSSPNSMKADEVVFTASKLITDIKEQGRVYESAAIAFPNDHRILNNAGAVAYADGNYNKAKSYFEKALAIMDNNKSKNNLAGISMVNGERRTAKKMLSQIKEKSTELNYNNSIIMVLEGNYRSAITGFAAPSFNKALAQVLAGRLDEASKTLGDSKDKESADSYYLKAIISSRSNAGVDAVVSNLKSAIAKDGKLREKAAKDREFIKLMEDATFKAAVN
jgi:tetratricopeptide (TPR) repeat protein/outer membrane protein OmpA-like peptidoglycan-associated protein